jgi:hypothetical protein
MSFDLGVWYTARRLTHDEANSLYTAPSDTLTNLVTPHPAVDAFYAELTARYPEIDTVPDDRIDDHDYCPWSCALDRSPGQLLMSCVWPQSENVERFVRGLASKYGLAVYNPQQGRVSYPGGALAASMSLELESGWIIRGVTADDILSCVEGEDFAILAADPNTYIQCAEQKESPYEYVLEYQGGSLDEHYRATDEPITLERLRAAFVKYLQGDASWRTDFRWEKMKL